MQDIKLTLICGLLIIIISIHIRDIINNNDCDKVVGETGKHNNKFIRNRRSEIFSYRI